jgi:glycine/D-amino acid oxidase-like deaminating enzyme
VSTALELQDRGYSVALCEKGAIGAEQSSRNWGWVRKMGRDPREIPLSIEALRLWGGMNARIEAETGFRRTGILYTCDTPEEIARRERWLDYARPYQLDTKLIGADEVAAMLPGTTHRFEGGLYTASDGRAEPQKAAPAIANAIVRRGGTVLTNCAVRGIERQGGRVSAVVTERGTIRTQAVVLAGGAWSGLFLRSLEVRLPQLKVMNTVLRTEPLKGPTEGAAWTPDFAIRKRLDGGYTVANGHANVADIVPDSFRYFGDFLPALKAEWSSLQLRLGGRFIEEWRTPKRWALDRPSPFERVRILDPEPSRTMADRALEGAAERFPVFKSAKIAQRWAGLIDVTPDAVPVISGIDAIPGLFVATGFSGHGFGIGPAAGRLAADLVTGAVPIVDPSPFRFSRFSDGSNPRPVAGL